MMVAPLQDDTGGHIGAAPTHPITFSANKCTHYNIGGGNASRTPAPSILK